ncbi:synaptosomal-associated protein 47-like [Dendronephthya gigantea]|uniref:synaptosomal-associated protein 47-like n=1 Tax=Dendronephthya gigantea TaxID=151771 RepID=UPI00106C6752|nr:synaptosomal-associated protein 47-like [Dendronephthya gigantea]XP_028393309.1 synaptosomal-associated protein 47-like [Dendronephthya gigantea]XP_028393310.1 synaptosomal-associated protein 47-like [Dendronephthya gigantea]XP_028393311.1 synaptosomal-associated protein 47-like [Dendronephthya gigantea]XP_028393312.1 synaptosomal-associated protein 47-like [Dendronephthya gigantea]
MEYYVIQEWEASYYCWESRTWKDGKLSLSSKFICFSETNSEPNSGPNVTADLRRVTGFQRRLVSLIYKAVVVNVNEEKPLWFSSLANREETYYFLEHFWKQRLLSLGPRGENELQGRGHDGTSGAGHADRKQIFEMLYDSEKTLIDASNSLGNQGEQLDRSARTMNRMHKDLNVTETLINGLDRWFTKWDMKPEDFFEIKMKKEYPVLYRKHTKECYFPGSLVFTEGQLTVLNIKRVADVSILLNNLTSIIVNTPWNIVLLRSAIGEVDVMVDISSAQVVYVLKALQSEHGHKFNYDEISDTKKVIKVSEMPKVDTLVFDNDHKQQVGDEDLEAVGDIVGNLKSLAVGINQEMTRQVECLDQLSESVDKAEHRIRKNTRKVEKKL